jgi:hypothetical protein
LGPRSGFVEWLITHELLPAAAQLVANRSVSPNVATSSSIAACSRLRGYPQKKVSEREDAIKCLKDERKRSELKLLAMFN